MDYSEMNGFLTPPQWHDTLGSTNDEALALAARGAPEGAVVAADRQTSGRGRQGRPWVSPPGVGLYASLVLRPALADGELTWLPLLAGLAAAEAIREVAGCDARLKWPNDVLVGGRKVAGLLVEAELAAGDERAVVVLGLGVNVTTPRRALPVRPLYPATSLWLETGRRLDRGVLLDLWRRRVAEAYARWQGGDTAALRARWDALDALRGTTVRVAGADGVEVRGLAEGLDGQGALCVRTGTGTVTRVVAGDVLRATRRSSSGRC